MKDTTIFELACKALELFGAGPHKVSAQLDINDESPAGFEFLQKAMELAYKAGQDSMLDATNYPVLFADAFDLNSGAKEVTTKRRDFPGAVKLYKDYGHFKAWAETMSALRADGVPKSPMAGGGSGIDEMKEQVRYLAELAVDGLQLRQMRNATEVRLRHEPEGMEEFLQASNVKMQITNMPSGTLAEAIRAACEVNGGDTTIKVAGDKALIHINADPKLAALRKIFENITWHCAESVKMNAISRAQKILGTQSKKCQHCAGAGCVECLGTGVSDE